MFNLDKTLIIVLVIVLIIFGPTQLPKLMKSFGKSAKALREGMDADPDEEEKAKAKKAAAKDDEEEDEE